VAVRDDPCAFPSRARRRWTMPFGRAVLPPDRSASLRSMLHSCIASSVSSEMTMGIRGRTVAARLGLHSRRRCSTVDSPLAGLWTMAARRLLLCQHTQLLTAQRRSPSPRDQRAARKSASIDATTRSRTRRSVVCRRSAGTSSVRRRAVGTPRDAPRRRPPPARSPQPTAPARAPDALRRPAARSAGRPCAAAGEQDHERRRAPDHQDTDQMA